MKYKCEASTPEIGVDGALTRAMENNTWGVKFTFSSEENDSRFEVALDPEQAMDFIERIQKSLKEIESVKKIHNELKEGKDG